MVVVIVSQAYISSVACSLVKKFFFTTATNHGVPFFCRFGSRISETVRYNESVKAVIKTAPRCRWKEWPLDWRPDIRWYRLPWATQPQTGDPCRLRSDRSPNSIHHIQFRKSVNIWRWYGQKSKAYFLAQPVDQSSYKSKHDDHFNKTPIRDMQLPSDQVAL